MTNMINTSVEIKLDANGRPSTDPVDVIHTNQQLLTKALLDRTNNGTTIPTDSGEVLQLIRDSSNIALLSRKINVDAGQENNAHQAEKLAMAHAKLRQERRAPVAIADSSYDPLAGILPPPATLGEGEGLQGPQLQIPEDYIDPN